MAEQRVMRRVVREEERGVLLPEALAALAVLGLVAVGAAGMAAVALRGERLAAEHAAARRAAVSALARVATVSWVRLPLVFGGSGDDTALAVSSSRNPGHGLVAGLAEGLPRAEVLVRAEGLAPGGAAARFREAVAIRVRARVTWRGRDGAVHRVVLAETRY